MVCTHQSRPNRGTSTCLPDTGYLSIKIVLAFHATGQGLACQISVAYCAMVRSLENLPELRDIEDRLAGPCLAIRVQRAEAPGPPPDRRSGPRDACRGRRVSAACRAASGRRRARSGTEVVAGDQVECGSRLGVVLVMPVRAVPAATVDDLLRGEPEEGTNSLRLPLAPSRWSRRPACRRSTRRSS